MNRYPAIHGFRRFIRVHERKLVAAFIIGMLLFGGIVSMGMFVNRIRASVLYRVERILDYWDERWTRRVEYGEHLVSSKEYLQATEYLVTLDRDFPARVVQHKRGRERQRVLRALGFSYSEMEKKRLALDTYRRLVDFDPRDFESHYLMAQACLKFREPQMAQEYLAGVLKIHPTHMPSVRDYLKFHFEKADFAAVIAAYENYLNAFLMQELTVALGQSSTKVYVSVDGRFHDVELRLPLLPESPGELALHVGEVAIEIKRVTMQSPVLVGKPGVLTTPIWPNETPWRAQEMAPIGVGSYRALGTAAALHRNVPPQPHGIAAIHLRLRLFKPFDPELWDMVQKSYQNLLRYDDLKTVRNRSVISIAQAADL
jgi:tetratricopeptide (TPR) repeat protein